MCGDREKSFKFDIGPMYRDSCCREKGYLVDGTIEGAEPEDNNPNVEEPKELEVEDVVEEPAVEVDLASKSTKELKELATQKGLKFGKRDSKKSMLKLLKDSEV